MARRSGGAPAWLVPLPAAVAASALLVVFRDLEPGVALLPALLALAGGLLILHSLLAAHLRRTTAFLAGLELAYATLLLLRVQAEPLLGLGLPTVARLLALCSPATLILVYALGQGRLLGASAALRALLIVGLPLLAALALRWLPGPAAALLAAGLVPLARPALLPQLGVVVLAAFLLFLALRPSRGFYDLCLACTLLPRFLLLRQAVYETASGAQSGFAVRAALAAVLCLLALSYGLYRLFWQRAFLDELTGIGNRRSFEDALRAVPRRFTVAMMDIDHFKAVNDSFGHAEGDNVLRWVASRLKKAFGSAAFRYGGEEFAVLLPETDAEAAGQRLEELRAALAEEPFRVRGGPDRRGRSGRRDRRRGRRGGPDRRAARQDRRHTPHSSRSSGSRPPAAGYSRLRVTVSIGLCSSKGGPESPREALLCADAALYRAKRSGRNRVAVGGVGGAAEARAAARK